MSNPDHRYVSRAMQLAKMGLGDTRPNPLVGCVIVYDGRIIGEGYHRRYGGPHAEVEAVSRVADLSLLNQSTVYVNLEPCSHHGKTPPCSDLLIRHGVRRVVIANEDPNPLVAGRGIRRLREHGIEVETGVLAPVGHHLNRRFFTFHQHRRPYIILKWAQTRDGYLARANGDSKWISGIRARQWVHRWRAEEAAILVGRGTARQDNPQLTTRHWAGHDPIRVVLDPGGRLDAGLHLFDGRVPTLRFVTGPPRHAGDVTVPGTSYLSEVLHELYRRDIQSVLVEGGAATLRSFLEAGLWDEARVFTGRQLFGDGISAPDMAQSPDTSKVIGEDELKIFFHTKTIE